MRHWHTWLGGRRAVALLALVLVVVAAVAVAPRAESWIGSWKQALDLSAGATALLGPVAAGAACLAYSRLHSSAASEIVLQAERDWLRWLQPFLAVWALASAALLVVTVGATTAAIIAGAPAYPQFAWVLLPALAVLGAQTAVGAAIGYASGRSWAAPMAVVIVFLLFLWTINGPVPTLFVMGGATATLAGEKFAVLPVLGPGVFALGFGWCVLAVAHRRLLTSTPAGQAVLAIAVVLAGIGWWSTGGDNDGRYVRVDDPPLSCMGSAPEVCVFREVPRPLADLAGKVDHQARALIAIGAPVPARFVPEWAVRPSEGVVHLWVDEESKRRVSVDSATRTLVKPARCPADSADTPVPLPFEERHLLGRWLQVRAGLLEPDPGDSDAAWLAARSVAPQEQEAWIRTTYRQLAECDYERIRMPDGLG